MNDHYRKPSSFYPPLGLWKILAFGWVIPALLSAVSQATSPSYETDDLLEMSIEDLMDLTIESSASFSETTIQTVPAAITTITQDEIRDSGARSLFELLDIYVPNFQWVTHWNDRKHMGLRGIISNLDDKYLLLVNGKNMNERTTFGAWTERDMPMMSDIHHIDVVRGPGSALYGPGALAMVINIITDNANTFQGHEVTLRGGAIERFGALEYKYGNKLSDDKGLLLYLGASEYEGSQIDDSPIVLGRPNQSYNGTTYEYDELIHDHFQNFNGAYKDRPRYKLHGQYTHGGFDIWARYTQGGENIDNMWPVYDAGAGYQQSTLTANYEHEVASNLTLKYVVSYDRVAVETATEVGTRGAQHWHHAEEELYGRVLAAWNPKEAHALALGTEWSHEFFGQGHSGKQAYISFGGNYTEDWETDLVSLFGEYQWQLDEQWTWFLSSRLDKHTYTDLMFSPKTVLVYTPTKQDALKFMLSESVRTNSASVMKENHNNGRDVDTESLKAAEFRYERQQTTSLSSALSVFYYDHDLIGYAVSDVGGYSGFQPLGKARSWGAELEVSYQTKRARFNFSHSYTKLLGTDILDGLRLRNIEFSGEPLGYGCDFANWSNHQTKLSSQYKINEAWRLDGSLNVYWGYPGGKNYGEMLHAEYNSNYYTMGYTKSFNPSAYLNLGAQYKLDEQTNIQIMGHNLLGLVDEYLNKRRSGFTIRWAGLARMHAPSISMTLKRTF